MKIAYVDLKYDYGIKSRGLNQIGQVGFLNSLRKLNHEVHEFYYDEYLIKTEELQTEVINFADSINPDLIFFCLYTDQFKPQTLLKLKSKYKTINWFGDDQWRFESFTKLYADCFTYCVTTDFYALRKYQEINIKNVILSQWAALESSYPDSKQIEYKYDISFIGGAHSTRRWIISEFEKAGLNVNCFGLGWPNGPVSLEQMAQIFSQSRINLNLSNSISYDLRYLTHSWKNIAVALRSKKNVNQMKARNFEIPYFGGFQLTDYLPSLEMYLDIGKDVACFSNVDEAIAQSRYYLKNEEVREQIKHSGIARVRREHTYLNRFEKILGQL